MATKRIYVVTNGTGTVALVRAASRAQAVGHVVRNSYSAKAATADDVADLLAAGNRRVEDAVEQATEEA